MTSAYSKKSLLLQRPYLPSTLRNLVQNKESGETVINSQKKANEYWLNKTENILILLDSSFKDLSNQALSEDETTVDSCRMGENESVMEWRISLEGGKKVGQSTGRKKKQMKVIAAQTPIDAQTKPPKKDANKELMKMEIENAVQQILGKYSKASLEDDDKSSDEDNSTVP